MLGLPSGVESTPLLRVKEEGAQRAASKRRISSSLVMLSPVIARGDQRSRMSDSIAWSALRFSLPLITSERNAGEPIEKAGNDESRRAAQSSGRGSGFGLSTLIPVGSQGFHLRPEGQHARGHPFVFFRNAVDLAIDRALAHKTLQFFVGT